MTTSTRLALAALLALAACSENAAAPDDEATTPTGAPQDDTFAGDIAAATRKAVADTEAAGREAGITASAAPETGAAEAPQP